MLKSNFTSSVYPCLIVLDLNMPKMSGTQTLSKIKCEENFKHIPVIIYSTSINPVEKEKCYSLVRMHSLRNLSPLKKVRKLLKLFLQFCQSNTIV